MLAASNSLPWEVKLSHVNRLMVPMQWAGYAERHREIVARRVLGKIEMNQYNLKNLGKPLYRSKQERKEVIKKDKSNWFREEGATTTITVPSTTNSFLAKQLKEVVAKTQGPKGTSVKVVEKPGPPIMAGIAANNPFKDRPCWKEHRTSRPQMQR